MPTNLDFDYHMVPPGGYHFPVAAGIIVRGATWDDLVTKVRSWRIDNGKDVGHPREDILAYFEKTWPTSVRYLNKSVLTSADGAEPVRANDDNFSRIMRWLNRLRDRLPLGGVTLVGDDERAQRRTTCSKCPKHKPLTISCSKCASALYTSVSTITRGKVSDTVDGYCTVLGAPCGVLQAVPVNTLGLSETSQNTVWGGCWMYKPKRADNPTP